MYHLFDWWTIAVWTEPEKAGSPWRAAIGSSLMDLRQAQALAGGSPVADAWADQRRISHPSIRDLPTSHRVPVVPSLSK